MWELKRWLYLWFVPSHWSNIYCKILHYFDLHHLKCQPFYITVVKTKSKVNKSKEIVGQIQLRDISVIKFFLSFWLFQNPLKYDGG